MVQMGEHLGSSVIYMFQLNSVRQKRTILYTLHTGYSLGNMVGMQDEDFHQYLSHCHFSFHVSTVFFSSWTTCLHL